MAAVKRQHVVFIIFIMSFLSVGLEFRAAPVAAKLSFEVKPTILFIEDKGLLKQRLDILIENPGAVTSG